MQDFIVRMLSDESGAPSSARTKQFLCFLVAVLFGLVGLFVSGPVQTFAGTLVTSFLAAGGLIGSVAQAKSAYIQAPKTVTSPAPTQPKPQPSETK